MVKFDVSKERIKTNEVGERFPGMTPSQAVENGLRDVLAEKGPAFGLEMKKWLLGEEGRLAVRPKDRWNRVLAAAERLLPTDQELAEGWMLSVVRKTLVDERVITGDYYDKNGQKTGDYYKLCQQVEQKWDRFASRGASAEVDTRFYDSRVKVHSLPNDDLLLDLGNAYNSLIHSKLAWGLVGTTVVATTLSACGGVNNMPTVEVAPAETDDVVPELPTAVVITPKPVVKTAEPTVPPTEVVPTKVVPPAIAMPSSEDLTAAGMSRQEFDLVEDRFANWWQYWAELGVVSAEYMPPATPEAGVSASAVYRIFVDAVTGKKMVGVEVLSGNYAGQILTFPLGWEDGDVAGRPGVEEAANDPQKKAYPIFLSGGTGDVGRHADHWVRFGENNRVIAYVDPLSGSWVEGPLAEALNFYGFDTMPATEAEALAGCPVAPDPINDTQNFLAWREEYRATITDLLLPMNLETGSSGQTSDDLIVTLPDGTSYSCYQFEHDGVRHVMVTLRWRPENVNPSNIFEDFLVDRNDLSQGVDERLSRLADGGSLLLRRILDPNAFYEETSYGSDSSFLVELMEAVPDIHAVKVHVVP